MMHSVIKRLDACYTQLFTCFSIHRVDPPWFLPTAYNTIDRIHGLQYENQVVPFFRWEDVLHPLLRSKQLPGSQTRLRHKAVKQGKWESEFAVTIDSAIMHMTVSIWKLFITLRWLLLFTLSLLAEAIEAAMLSFLIKETISLLWPLSTLACK